MYLGRIYSYSLSAFRYVWIISVLLIFNHESIHVYVFTIKVRQVYDCDILGSNVLSCFSNCQCCSECVVHVGECVVHVSLQVCVTFCQECDVVMRVSLSVLHFGKCVLHLWSMWHVRVFKVCLNEYMCKCLSVKENYLYILVLNIYRYFHLYIDVCMPV